MKRRPFVHLWLGVIALTMAASMATAQWATLPGDDGIASAAGTQRQAELAAGGGSVLMVWSDNRSNPYGSYDYETSADIYGMRFDSNGTPLDANPIPIATGIGAQTRPKVAWNGTNWLVAFESVGLNSTGTYYGTRLEAVRVSPAGTVLDAKPIFIPGLVPTGYSHLLASDGNSWMLVNQGNVITNDLVGVRIGPDGTVLDPPTRTLVPGTYYMRSNFRIAFAAGVYLVTFDDQYVGPGNNTGAVRFDTGLNVLGGGLFTLNAASLGALVSNGSQFLMAFARQRPDFYMEVVGTRVGPNGAKLDPNGLVVSNPIYPGPYAVNAIWDGTAYRMLWTVNEVRAAKITAAGQVQNFDGVPLPGLSLGGSIAGLGGSLLFASEPYVGGDTSVAVQRVASTSAVGPLITASVGAPQQTRPDMARSNSIVLLVYRSATGANTRIMAQKLDLNAQPIGLPFALETGPGLNGPGSPSVAFNGSTFLVTWGNSTGLVGRRLDSSGNLLDSSPFTVLSQGFGPTDVAALGTQFLVVGRKYGSTPQVISAVAIRVSDSGAVLSGILVPGTGYLRTAPAVAVIGNRWYVAFISNWTHDESSASVAGSFVNANGVAEGGGGITLLSTAGGNGIFEIGLASNGNVGMLVVPQELTSGVENDLWARSIQADGTLGPQVNLTPWIGNQYRPKLDWDGTHFVLVYQEQKNRFAAFTMDQVDATSDLFGMRLNVNGSPLDPKGFALSTSRLGETDPTVISSNGVSLFAAALMNHDPQLMNYRIALRAIGGQGNRWPVAVGTASATEGTIPLTVDFAPTGSFDLDGMITEVRWEFGDGSFVNQPNGQHTYTVPGNYVAKLIVTDNNGATATQTFPIQVRTVNLPPVVVVSSSPASGPAPLNATFTLDGTYDPDGYIGNITWRYPDDSYTYGNVGYYTFTQNGTYRVRAEVNDDRGAMTVGFVDVFVGGVNQPPIAAASASPATGIAPLPVNFSSAGTHDPDGNIASWAWTFGDGGTANYANPVWIYTQPGDYVARLTVRDNVGAMATTTVPVSVRGIARSTDVRMSARLFRNTVTATASVTVKNPNGDPISGADVTVNWTLPRGSRTQTVRTDANGVARFNVSGPRGTYTATVTSIVKPFYTFDSANSVLSGTITR